MLVRCPAFCISSPALLRATPRLAPLPAALAARARRRYASDPAATTHDVAVLGGGITGLASAYYLIRELPTATVTIYEASDRIGGWLASKRVPVRDGTVLFEAGPRSLRPNSHGVLSASLMQELDLTKDAIFTQKSSPAARNRYVYYPDRLVRMPHPTDGLSNILWRLLGEPAFETAIWSGLREFWKEPRDPSVLDESIGDFLSRRLSKTMVDRLISGVIHGIYAGDVYKLSARSLFTTAYRDEGLHGSVLYGALKARAEGIEMSKRDADFLRDMKAFEWDPLLQATLKDNSVFTFRDGLGMLSDRLYAKLFETGRVEFKTGARVESITQAEGNTGIRVTTSSSQEPETRRPHTHSHVISALSPWHLNALTPSAKDGSKQLVPTIPTVTVMTVNLYFRTPDLHEPGFGYLIPQATPFENNPERALGVVFDTAYSPGPADVNPANWQEELDVDKLMEDRDQGQLVNINDFAWYNLPEKPNTQDHVKERGTKLTVMLGGHWWDGWPAYPDEKEGLALARSVLERHLGIKETPEAWQVNLEKDCIPQYTVGHEQRLKQAHDNIWHEYKGRLRVAGNWMSGVGVNDCLRSAYEVAKNMRKDGTGLEHIGEAHTVRLKPVRYDLREDNGQ